MAKKKKRSAASGSARRRRGDWSTVTYEELDAWRAERGISKKRMAEHLGVTNSTYHNWARGTAVATPHTQARIRRLLDGVGLDGAGAEDGGLTASSIALATARVVRGYLQVCPALSLEELVALVREVRAALGG